MGNGIMKEKLEPLYYAIIKLYMDDEPRDALDVVSALEPDYSGYKLLTPKDVDEALATARENGLLDEVNCGLGDNGDLRIYYRMTEFGRDMVMRYI